MVAFCVKPPQDITSWTSKHVKAWQSAHLCCHTIDSALHGYATERTNAMLSNQALCRAAGPGKKLAGMRCLKRQISDEARPPASAASPSVTVTKFIQLPGNYGKEARLLPQPAADADKCVDSDDDDGYAPSNKMDEVAQSARNMRFLQKHGCKVSKSSEDAGMGLFASQEAIIGKEMPVKGPWFQSLAKLEAWLSEQHTDTATNLSTRVVRVDLKRGKEDTAAAGPAAAQADTADPPPASATPEDEHHSSIFKVMTCPVGFVNHFSRISNQANCQLVWKEGLALGEYNLVMKVTKKVPADKEFLLSYGPLHPVVERAAKRKRHPRQPPSAEEPGPKAMKLE